MFKPGFVNDSLPRQISMNAPTLHSTTVISMPPAIILLVTFHVNVLLDLREMEAIAEVYILSYFVSVIMTLIC